jgi:hypothetical protein
MRIALARSTSAAFGHHFAALRADGAHFHPARLSLPRRPTALSSSNTDLADDGSGETHTRLLCAQWAEMPPAFASDQDLSGTHGNRLWNGIIFVLKASAARSVSWGVAEVSTACRAQLDGLPRNTLLSPRRRWPRLPEVGLRILVPPRLFRHEPTRTRTRPAS